MFRTCFPLMCAFAVAAASSSPLPLPAQAKAAAPKSVPVNISHAGIARLYEDLEYVFKLADEPKAFNTLKETLDVFFEGVDPKVPAVFQVYVRKGKFNTVLHAPTVGLPKVFRNNISTIGIKSQTIGPGEYSLKGLFKGFMRESNKMSIIAEERADTAPIPGGLGAYKKKLDPSDSDLIASIINDAAQIEDRKKAIEEVRTQVKSGIKKLKNETDTQFELRKLTFDQQLTEIQQIYGEAANIHSILNLLPAKKSLSSTTDVKALPDTELAKVIDSLAKEPSYFANIPLSSSEPLSGMINLKLDSLRQQHMKNFLTQARPLIQDEIKKAEGSSGKTKEYTQISTDIIFDVLEKETADGLYDGFINVHANQSGVHTMVGGTKVDGAVVKAGLQKLQAAANVEMDAGKVGDVELHKVTLPGDLTELQSIYGKDLVLILGTSPQAVWYAMGENAEAKLKEAIEKASQPAAAASNLVVSLHGRALIWYELFDAHRTKNKKGDASTRQEALKALKAGGDIFDFKIEKADGGLKLSLDLHEGMLRYFGKVGAKFVRENFDN